MTMIQKLIKKICNRETISYLICGILATIINIAIFWLCEKSGLSVALSNTIATLIAICFAYFTNKLIVFRSFSWKFTTLAKEIFTFATGRIITFVIETLLLVLLVDVMSLNSFISKLFTTALIQVIGNYIISKKIVFKAEADTLER